MSDSAVNDLRGLPNPTDGEDSGRTEQGLPTWGVSVVRAKVGGLHAPGPCDAAGRVQRRSSGAAHLLARRPGTVSRRRVGDGMVVVRERHSGGSSPYVIPTSTPTFLLRAAQKKYQATPIAQTIQ
jgi:hypothetical protein